MNGFNNIKDELTCREALEWIPLYCLEDDSLTAERIQAIETHLLQCPTCAEDLIQTEYLQHVLTTHRDYFLEAIDWSDSSEDVSPDTGKKSYNQGLQRFIPSITRLSTRIAGIAAVIAICLGLGWEFWANQGEHDMAQQNNSQIRIDSPELTITENGMAISHSDLLTSGPHIREFLINGNRHIVLNRHTQFTIEPLQNSKLFGCVVNLITGHIQAHVEHDGKPFEVHFPHGQAVITGTTFDVRITDDETSLVVSEGSVRFESDKGTVQVNASHRSTLRAQSKPTAPVACNAESLMAWADEGKNLPQIAHSVEDLESYKLAEELTMLASYPGRPIDLDSLDYEEFVEEKREWFKGQFPWIFELQEALITNTENRKPKTEHRNP